MMHFQQLKGLQNSKLSMQKGHIMVKSQFFFSDKCYAAYLPPTPASSLVDPDRKSGSNCVFFREIQMNSRRLKFTEKRIIIEISIFVVLLTDLNAVE